MNNYLKLSSIALYILAIISFFVIGAFIPGMIGSVSQEGMEGGPTVLLYGFGFAVIGFIVALFMVRYISQRTIVRLNWILLVLLTILIFGVFFPIIG